MVLTAITFFIILSLLVFIHELGHFLVARWIGVGVEEFGFGLPPRIWGKKVGKTTYSINWLPVGGFVKLAGEDEEDENSKLKIQNSKLKGYFWARTKKERGAILVAGVVMNFFLAVGITTYLLTDGVMEHVDRVHVESVQPDSPAQDAGLKAGDRIVSIRTNLKSGKSNSAAEVKDVTASKALIDVTKAHAGEEILLTIVRDSKTLSVVLVPRVDPPQGQGPMGVVISDLEKRQYSWSEAPVKALRITVGRAKEMLVSLGSTLWRLVTFQKLQADIAGPIGIAQVTGEAVRFGFKAVLEFMSILSLNLAVLNILPFPALDGGRLAFVFLEKLLGRRVRPAFERSTHQIGMIILFGLILLVSLHDILRIAGGS